MRTSSSRLGSTLASLVAVLLVAGCAGDRAPQAEEAAPTDDMAEAATPTDFMYVAHPIADWETWLEVYEAQEEPLVSHGLSELWIYRDLDQDGVIHLLHSMADVEAAKHFAMSETLADAMKDAGVTGEPTIFYMSLVEGTQPEMMPDAQYNVLVAHEVADWDAWKAAFDAHAGARAEAGLTSRGVARGIDNANMIYLNFAATDLEAARAFAASDDLKSAMEGAGVVGEPLMFFTETVRATAPPVEM